MEMERTDLERQIQNSESVTDCLLIKLPRRGTEGWGAEIEKLA